MLLAEDDCPGYPTGVLALLEKRGGFLTAEAEDLAVASDKELALLCRNEMSITCAAINVFMIGVVERRSKLKASVMEVVAHASESFSRQDRFAIARKLETLNVAISLYFASNIQHRPTGRRDRRTLLG